MRLLQRLAVVMAVISLAAGELGEKRRRLVPPCCRRRRSGGAGAGCRRATCLMLSAGGN